MCVFINCPLIFEENASPQNKNILRVQGEIRLFLLQ